MRLQKFTKICRAIHARPGDGNLETHAKTGFRPEGILGDSIGRFIARPDWVESLIWKNVLRGDMSLVRPAPALATNSEEYTERLARRRVSGNQTRHYRYGRWKDAADPRFDERVRLDLRCARRSVWRT